MHTFDAAQSHTYAPALTHVHKQAFVLHLRFPPAEEELQKQCVNNAYFDPGQYGHQTGQRFDAA